LAVVGCASVPEEPTLDELLRKYMGPKEQMREDFGDPDGTKVTVYYLDPLRFEEFKAELDAGDGYQQTANWNDGNERGRSFLSWNVIHDDECELDFGKGKTISKYWYEREPQEGVEWAELLDEILHKYMGASVETWDDDNAEIWGNDEDELTYVYYLNPLHFAEFKAELDASGEYVQTENWTEDERCWGQGLTFARFAERPDGTVVLDLCKKDNSVVGYRYK
jgi:hypothetical protein